MTNRVLVTIIFGLAVFSQRGVATAANVLQRPNILFIVVDTLRRDHVGCYDYGRDTTPALDRLAAEGARFQEAIAASSWTVPSMMSIFTSVSPTVHGATTFTNRLADGLTTVAAELLKSGYQTMAITSNPATNRKFGFARGFELYDDFSITLSSELDLFSKGAAATAGLAAETSRDVNRLAIQWLRHRRDTERPFFLHLLYFDPHDPYQPVPPYDTMFVAPGYAGNQNCSNVRYVDTAKLTLEDKARVIGLYDGEVRHTDEHLGHLFAEIKALKLDDNTLIIVTSDHGEEFWDHGGTTHGHTLYEELVRVPLVVRYPAGVEPGTVVDEQVRHVDYMPTILDVAGVPIPAQCEGRSFLSVMSGGHAEPAVPAFMETIHGDQRLSGARTREHKVIETQGADGVSVEAYSLKSDPGERTNLTAVAPAPQGSGGADLLDSFAEWRKRARVAGEALPAPDAPTLDPDLIRQLKALGYAR